MPDTVENSTPNNRLIIFDFDGTLVDSQRVIVECMTVAFANHNLPVPPANAVRRSVGLALERAIASLLPDPDDFDLAALVSESYRQRAYAIRQSDEFDEPLFEGAREAIIALNAPEIWLGIATGKNRRGLLHSLEYHGLRHHFATLKTADDGPSKPHPEILHQAMAETGVAPEDTVMIGDTTYDMQLARNAGARAIGVSWGYHGGEELLANGAARVVANFAELLDELKAGNAVSKPAGENAGDATGVLAK
jgi:phosphoglycolate phosphatase